MRPSRWALLACLALALAACGQRQAGAGHASRPAAGAPLARGAQAQGPAAAKPAALAAQNAKLNPDGSEIVDSAAGDSGVHNALLAAVASAVAAATPSAAADTLSGPTLWQEGVNYTRLVPAQPTDVPAGQVEVLEFFWYACPHCFALEPLVDAWKKSKPAYITFSPVPVTWSDGHRALAHLFYTLEALGKLDQLHDEVFKEIQVNGDPLVARDPSNEAETERMQAAFAVKEGISAEAFKSAYHSIGVDTRLQRADELVQRYRIDGVPTFVVNGKYIADVRSAGGPDKLLSLVSDLAAQEHKR